MAFLSKFFPKTKQPSFTQPFSIGGSIPPDYTSQDFIESYQTVGWWHAVVFRIALGMSEVCWTLHDVSTKDKPKKIDEHPVLDFLHLVNPFQTSEEFIALDTIYMESCGESFWVLNFNNKNEPAEAILAYPELMSVIPDKAFPFVKGYVYGNGANAIPLDVNQVIHFKYPNPSNQFRGLSQAKAIGVNLSADKNADKWVNQFFYNSARPDGVIQFDYTLSDEQFNKLREQWAEKYKGVNKAHQVALLEGGGKYIQIQNTVKDMDFATLKQKNRDIILGVEGMPQSVMGISENVNKANAEAGDYTFARWIIKPRLNWKRAKLQEQLLPKFKGTEKMKLGFEEVVPETEEQKRLNAESAIRSGYWTVNEARTATGKDPLPPEVGDVLLLQLNILPTPIDGSKPNYQPPAPETPEETPEEEPEEEGKSFSPEKRLEIWNRFNQKTLRQEQAFNRVFANVWTKQKVEIDKYFSQNHKLPDYLDDQETAKQFQPLIETIYVGGRELAESKQFDLLDEYALNWIATRSLNLAKSVNSTTLDALRSTLAEGYGLGESIQRLTKRILEYFETSERWRAERIARTEVLTASIQGQLDQFKSEGLTEVEWMASPNSCDECLPLDGQIIKIADGNNFPPKHPQCTCTILAVS